MAGQAGGMVGCAVHSSGSRQVSVAGQPAAVLLQEASRKIEPTNWNNSRPVADVLSEFSFCFQANRKGVFFIL